MSGPPKYTPPPYPMRIPYSIPMMNPDRLMNLPLNLPRNGNPPQQHPNGPPAPGINSPGFPFLPNRMFNPYLNNYGMMQPQQFIPYSPFGRPQNPIPPPRPEHVPEQKPILQKVPPQEKIAQKNPPKIIEVEENLEKAKPLKKQNPKPAKPAIVHTNQKDKSKAQQPFSKKSEYYKQISKQHSTQNKKGATQKSSSKYIPYDSKKKMKKQLELHEPIVQRKTREKKPSIQRLFIQIMKEKPQRDLIMKIGKEHQATIPESYLNEYQYTLKVKLEKKRSLLQRMITDKGHEQTISNTLIQNTVR